MLIKWGLDHRICFALSVGEGISMTTLEEIISWASVFTGENRSYEDYYYVTEPVKRLEWSLTHVKRQLIALIGLQGTGKTSALKRICVNLWKMQMNVKIIKWTENWFDSIRKDDDELREYIDKEIEPYVNDSIMAYGHSGKKHPVLGRELRDEEFTIEGFERIYEKANFQWERFLGKARVKGLEREFTFKYLQEKCPIILIDLPDYTKTDRRLMSKHLLEVQELWEKVGADKNIVIAIQKELFTGHFFFGKMDAIELTPLKPEELMHVFKTQFPKCNLIMDDALILLGQLSRGVFRRFLKYLKLTCEHFAISQENPPITIAHVNKAVAVEQLMKDMELELYDIFKDVNQRKQAIQLLNYLRASGTMNQKDIAEFLCVSMPTSARIVARLLTYDYVIRKRGEGREWVISLKV